MGGAQSSPYVVEENGDDAIITVTHRVAEYQSEGGNCGAEQKVVNLRNQNTLLKNFVVAQQEELNKFERSLNEAIETINQQEVAQTNAQDMQHQYEAKLDDLTKERESHRLAAQEAFDAAASHVQSRIRELVPPSDSQTCGAERSSVLNCFRANPGQALNCSQETRALKECARKATQNTKS